MELVAIAQDVGADKSDGVCKERTISVKVVTSWSSIYDLAVPAEIDERARVSHKSTYNNLSPSQRL